jgi:hypothetical protein
MKTIAQASYLFSVVSVKHAWRQPGLNIYREPPSRKGRQKIVVRGYDAAGFRVPLVRAGGGKTDFPEYTPGCRSLAPSAFGARI